MVSSGDGLYYGSQSTYPSLVTPINPNPFEGVSFTRCETEITHEEMARIIAENLPREQWMTLVGYNLRKISEDNNRITFKITLLRDL